MWHTDVFPPMVTDFSEKLFSVVLWHKGLTQMNPGKMVPETWSPRKIVPGKLVPENLSPRKMVLGKMVPEKMVPGKMVPEKNGPRKISPRKIGPWKNGPRKIGKLVLVKLKNEKSWGWRRVSWCVCVWNVGMWLIYKNPKLDNKPKTPKQTQNTETKNRRVSVKHRGVCVCVCVWNVRM